MSTTDLAAPTARSLSKEEYEQWVQQSFQDEQDIKAGLRNARAGLWQAAEALYRFSEASGWVALGHESLGDWLADPEITMSRSTFFRMVDAHRELVVLRHCPNVGTLDLTKVSIALPALKKGTATLEDVMADVEALGARDMREKYSLRVLPSGAEADLDENADFANETGERLDESEPDYDAGIEIDASGPVEFIERGIAVSMALVLEELHRALPPERRAISKSLRESLTTALSLAISEGLLDA